MLSSCQNKFLSAEGSGELPNNLAQQANAAGTEWRLEPRGGSLYSLRSGRGTWLSAVPPVEGKQAMFLTQTCLQAETWELAPITPKPPPSAAAPTAAAAIPTAASLSGLPRWGPSDFYSLRNCATGMYLASHPDGQLVAEDDTTDHHDLVWSIATTPAGTWTGGGGRMEQYG